MRKALLLILTLGGLFDASYLWWVYTSPSRPLVCSGIGCDTVRATKYAHLWGHPLPLYGVLMYSALLLLLLAEGALESWEARRAARIMVTLVAAGGVAFSIYLTALEAFVIHAYCHWCLGSAAAIVLIFVLSILELRSTARGHADDLETASARSAWQLRSAIIVVVMGVAGFGLFRYLASRPEIPQTAGVPDAVLDAHLVRPDSHVYGNPNAPVTVVEFGDFECPGCGLAQPIVEEMLARYGNRVRFVFRQNPLVEAHPYAMTAAEVSECAADQGKFWEVQRKFYQEQADLTEPALEHYAAELGLNVKAIDQCLIDGTVRERIERDLADGKAVGVGGTPTFFVGHEKFVGLTVLSQLTDRIDRQLAAAGVAAPPQTGSTETAPALNPSAPATANTASSGHSQPAVSHGSAGGAASSSADPSSGSGGGLGAFGASNSAFVNAASQELACTPEEAQKRQPILIHTADVQKLLDSADKPVIIDVRPAAQFPTGHLPGAISIPVDKLITEASKLPHDKTLVLYEGGKTGVASADVCAVSRAGARILYTAGFSFDRVKVFQEGLAAWQQAGLPVEK